MFSTVVIGTSLSDTSTRTLCCLQGLRAAGVRKAFLVHAMNIRDVGTLYRQLRTLAMPALERQKRVLEEMGFEVAVDVRLGIPYVEIDQVAREHDASLIAVHLTTETLLADVFVGGVAYELLQRADRPVLAMKAKGADGDCELLCENVLHHVLHPTDFSDNAERALAYVQGLAEAAQPAVTLVHVDETAAPAAASLARDRLEGIAQQLQRAGARQVSVEVVGGSPTTELLKIARRNEHSLIVMGSQGKGFIKEIFLGSVSHSMIRHAGVPVLVVPAVRT
jgi:nucleotide-binding universal stress UspA family protein